MRIGNGYDVHRLAEGRRLVIGGVVIEHECGLLGHSDADVLLHAIIDALLGAAGAGNIGVHFPDTDARYKDADSLCLLRQTAEIIAGKGYNVLNIDTVVVAQAPRLAPYVDKMCENIAQALGIDKDCVSVKPKTEEMLGFTGRKQGIKTYAVCLLE